MGLECDSILDVGANKGSWSVMASRVFRGSVFYLIEPQIEMAPVLKNLVEKRNNWKYFLIGAGSKNAEVVLTLWDDTLGSSFMPITNEELLEKGKQRVVKVKTINYLIETGQIEIPTILKIDVQGAELDVLEGASLTFGATEAFIIECSFFSFDDVPGQSEFYEVVKFMFERGYVVYDFAGFLRRPLDNALGQCDVVFVRADSTLRQSNKWQ